jgi:hypothetical protein
VYRTHRTTAPNRSTDDAILLCFSNPVNQLAR